MPQRWVSSLYGMCLFFLAASAPTTRIAAEDIGSIPEKMQAAISRDSGVAGVGAKNADVTLVEFFDYNCPFCKKLAPALQALLTAEPKVAVIYKDWPILSDVSVYAAKSALAANWQGKYVVAHDTLMAASHLSSNEQVDALLRAAGLDMKRLNKALEEHGVEIQRSLQRDDVEAHKLGLHGTPGLLVGRHIINGVYDLSGLRHAVAISRRDP